MEQFKKLFRFNPENTLKLGVERECHLTDLNGNIVAIAQNVLGWLYSNTNGRGKCYGYELSGCQFEERVERPCGLDEILGLMLRNQVEITMAERALGFKRCFLPLGPSDMPLEHYPDERYDRIVETLSFEALLTACQVTGVHILVGMPDPETALEVYNEITKHFFDLCRMGNSYDEEIFSPRLKAFVKNLVDVCEPPAYGSWQDFYKRALKEGFDKDPKRLWDFIRISVHGAIEFRMFDTTKSLDKIVLWADVCQSICREAM